MRDHYEKFSISADRSPDLLNRRLNTRRDLRGARTATQ